MTRRLLQLSLTIAVMGLAAVALARSSKSAQAHHAVASPVAGAFTAVNESVPATVSIPASVADALRVAGASASAKVVPLSARNDFAVFAARGSDGSVCNVLARGGRAVSGGCLPGVPADGVDWKLMAGQTGNVVWGLATNNVVGLTITTSAGIEPVDLRNNGFVWIYPAGEKPSGDDRLTVAHTDGATSSISLGGIPSTVPS